MEKFTAEACEAHLRDIFEAIGIRPEQIMVDSCVEMLHSRLMSGEFDPEDNQKRRMSAVNPMLHLAQLHNKKDHL